MRDTIKKHEHFAMADTDPIAKSTYFLVRMRRARIPGHPEYGLIVTKRMFKHAVDRNRAKRLMRDWIRFNEKKLRDDCDYVFISRRAILDATRTDGRTAMKKALHYLGKVDLDAPRITDTDE